jgi:hypothetical protein
MEDAAFLTSSIATFEEDSKVFYRSKGGCKKGDCYKNGGNCFSKGYNNKGDFQCALDKTKFVKECRNK